MIVGCHTRLVRQYRELLTFAFEHNQNTNGAAPHEDDTGNADGTVCDSGIGNDQGL